MEMMQSDAQKIGGKCYATILRKASRRMSQLYDNILEPGNLKTTQRAILAEVERSGPLTVGALASLLVMDAGGLAHTLKPLIRDGLLSINVDPSDKRNRLISIESFGLEKIRGSDALFDNAQECFERAFGEEEAKTLRDALRIIASEQFLKAFENFDMKNNIDTSIE